MTNRSTLRFARRCSLFLVAALLCTPGSPLHAQQPPLASPPTLPSESNLTTNQTTNPTTNPNANSSPNSTTNVAPTSAAGASLSNTDPRNSLTAAEIDDFLQAHPEVTVDLKSLLADRLRQQEVDVQADSIDDEMLFRQIATDAGLRADLTLWLQARGYITEADLHRSGGNSSLGGFSPGDSSPDDSTAPPARATFETQTRLADRFADNGFANPALLSAGSAGLPSTNPPSIAPARQSAANPRPPADTNAARNVTQEPEVLRRPTPYNLLSLRDLYTQVPEDDAKLKRFGSEVFLNRDGAAGPGARDMPIDLPVGPDYVLGSGDGLVVNIWGGVSQSLTRTVDREGKIVLPEAGSLVVAGLTLERAQTVVASALQQQFHNARVDLTIARLRTVRVYVVGDVQRPGAYDLSSLSTPINALYAAGGPTAVGSLRTVRHLRGTQLVREIDLYDFLLHGLRMDDERLESGDTLLVPPAGPQVAIFGMVKRPAIYELKGGELKGDATLADVLEDAGGATVAAALGHIAIERIQPNRQRETVSIDLPPTSTPQQTLAAIAAFNLKDGDRIHVAPILPYSERVIYVEGHVVRPGKFPYRDDMRLGDIVRTYQDLLPEPAVKGEIVRLVPPDLHPQTIPFDVPDLLIGNGNLALQPFDTIRIFGRYEADSPRVSIHGEVLRPGAYALSQGMTAAQLVKMAGGFKRDALLESADLTSYTIQNDKKIVGQLAVVAIGAAVDGSQPAADVALKPGDVLTIHQISGWNDIGAAVSLAGEVTYPGSYGLEEGERLSSVLRRAGGFRETAFPDGAILVRMQVRELEEKSRAELIRQIETTSASARLAPSLSSQDDTALLQAATQQQNEVLQRLRTHPASGRLVIHVSSDIASWAGTAADIELRSGDVLTVPKRPSFVLITGQVYNASAITFVPGKDAAWYLSRAGGTNDVANRKEIFIVRANGSVVGRRSGEWYGGNVLSTRLDPGDVIVIPQKIIGGSLFWRNLLTVAQISSSIAITAAVAGIL